MAALQERDPNAVSNSKVQGAKENLENLMKKPRSKAPKSKQASPQSKDSKKSTDKPPSAADLAYIHLEGEEDEEVPIFDTCNDVRSKIREHIKKHKGVSQASLSREFSEIMPNSKVSPRHVAKFLEFKGPRAGAHSPAFYGGYVYFEKLRIHQNKKKTKKREEMEEMWASSGGFTREGSHNMRLILPAGKNWRLDQYGCIDIGGQLSMVSGRIDSKRARK